jgi:toxin YoeB
MNYRINFYETADEDIIRWKKSGQKIFMDRISKLLKDIAEHPYYGIGKPEALRCELTGKWSCRISDEHRIVYEVDEVNNEVNVLSLFGHYEK